MHKRRYLHHIFTLFSSMYVYIVESKRKSHLIFHMKSYYNIGWNQTITIFPIRYSCVCVCVRECFYALLWFSFHIGSCVCVLFDDYVFIVYFALSFQFVCVQWNYSHIVLHDHHLSTGKKTFHENWICIYRIKRNEILAYYRWFFKNSTHSLR